MILPESSPNTSQDTSVALADEDSSRDQLATGERSEGRQHRSRRPFVLDVLLVLMLVFGSATIGWILGRDTGDELVLVEASFNEEQPMVASDATAAGVSEGIGTLKAEILHLRVLFQRLAEIAEIDHDGEFDVDFEIDSHTGDGEPLSQLDPESPDALPALFARLDPMIEQASRMQRIFFDRRREFDRRLSGRPLANGTVSSGFGIRTDPLTGARVMHRGLDFVGEVGEPILAIADGVVTWSGANGGYGLLVELEHADGFRTRYAHNDATLVELGSRVRKGEAIATLGSSGRSTGPHLHLEVRHRGEATDPRFYIR